MTFHRSSPALSKVVGEGHIDVSDNMREFNMMIRKEPGGLVGHGSNRELLLAAGHAASSEGVVHAVAVTAT